MSKNRTTITVSTSVKKRFLDYFGTRRVKSQGDMLETLIDENERLSEENQELRNQNGGGY